MLINLLKYEFTKRWKASRYVLLGFILLQFVLLAISGLFFWNDNMAKVFTEKNFECQSTGAASVIAMLIYFIAAVLIFLFPFFEVITSFNKDLSGRQSVLERMIPAASWKKILSKLITFICSAVLGAGLATLSVITFILVSSRFDNHIVNTILNTLRIAFQSPVQLILNILYILFCFLSLMLLIYLSITVSKVFSHKSKIAVPIGIAVFAALVTVLSFVNTFTLQFPIIRFNLLGEDSLSSLLVSLLVFIAALSGTAWLMDNKIEN